MRIDRLLCRYTMKESMYESALDNAEVQLEKAREAMENDNSERARDELAGVAVNIEFVKRHLTDQ